MCSAESLQFRLAGLPDVDAIAALHADSWQRHYRGAYSDSFLDGDLLADRSEVWNTRLESGDDRAYTVVAEEGGRLVGFAHTIFEADPAWGSLLDNLHVRYGQKRQGVGSTLLALIAAAVVKRESRLYLWALEQNVAARAFYEARDGRCVERALTSPPGGVAERLNGTPVKLRYAWTDPVVLRELAGDSTVF